MSEDKTIVPIETRYDGCRFRSRLEARWAVFMNTLGWKWDYEPQGFHLDKGAYLPDFWVETIHRWVEIKPPNPPDVAYELLQQLSDGTGKHAMLIAGDPWPEHHSVTLFRPGGPSEYELNTYSEGFCDCRKCDGGIWVSGDCGASSILCSCDPDRTKYPGLPENMSLVHKAHVAARSARFEYGETGGPA